MKILSLFLVTLTLALPALARTWTSTDGRTIEASLLSSGEDSVVLRLDATGATITVKKSLLSAEDIKFVNETPTLTHSTADVIPVILRYPTYAYKDENGKQLNDKYVGFVKIMTPDTAFSVCQLMRKKLPEDIKYWKEESEREIPDIRPPVAKLGESLAGKIAIYREKVSKLKAQKKIDKENYKWVSETLPAWIAEVEKAASQ